MEKSTQINKKTFRKADKAKTRQRIMGIIILAIGAFIWFVLARTTTPGLETLFVMTPGGSLVKSPDLKFNTLVVINTLAILCLCFGIFQFIKGFGKYTNFVLILVGIMLTTSFLAWGASGGSINVGGMLRIMIMRSIPIVLGALSGILCERAGVVNIAIEGMMITGALVGAVVGSLYGLWAGAIAATIAGGLISIVHGFLSIKYKVDQIISGTIINIFTIGITSYIVTKILQEREWQYLNECGIFMPTSIPLLSKIPYIGPILFNHNPYVYSMYIMVFVLTIALFYTKWGLRLRAVGEHPKAADTLGINVFGIRYVAVILGGMLAGFAGSYFSLGSAGYFNQDMTAGRGFIGLAAMIFGNWTPVGSLGAGLLFGFAESLANNLALLRVPIPSDILLMVPYILTMVVLAGVVGRSRGPAAAGTPYEKESL
ncbi:MAG: ABC transporter permease [Chloroflexota bacterium]|nr:ABC transporter permease [Chloroflexota bacterium]